MTERLPPEEIDELKAWLAQTTQGHGAAISRVLLWKAAGQFIELHDLVERLRMLDYRDVTDEQQERVCANSLYVTKKAIARSVRVMLRGET